jgi:putative aldouronate transport system substrate-binding protein
MKSKKILRAVNVFMVLVLTAAMLAGCGGQQAAETETTASVGQSSSGNGNATTQAVKEELAPVDLVWYQYGSPQPDQELVAAEVNKILKDKINATLTVIPLDYGSFNDKIKVLSASGDPFDLCFTAAWLNDYSSGVSNGAFMELDELLQKYGSNILKTIPPKYWEAVKSNGKIYAILNYQFFGYVKGIDARKDLVEKYNFDYKNVKKMEDMEPFFEAVKKGEPGITPYLGDVIAPMAFFNLETGFTYDTVTGTAASPLSIKVKDPQVKVINLYDEPQVMDYFKLMRSWYMKGYIRKDAASLKDILAEEKSGKYAAFAGGNLKPGNEIDTKSRDGYDVVDIPITPPFINTAGVLATMTAINKNAANPERAMMLYDLLYSDKELYNLLCFGIENKHYQKVSDNVVKQINPESSTYNPSTDWAFGNQFNAFYREGQPTDVWEKSIQLNEIAEPSPLLGFNYSKENMKNENAQLDAILAEYLTGLSTGSLDPEKSIPEMVAKMKRAGLDKVMEDAQKQIDAWRTANGK